MKGNGAGGWRAPLGAFVASVLAVAALAPTALASTEAETTATLRASSQNLSVTAPLSIPFALQADGTFASPSPAAAVIDNDSAFPVAVSSFEFASAAGNPVSKAEAAMTSETNSWWATMAPNGGEPISMNAARSEMSVQWNLAADGEGDAIELTCAGGIANADGTIGMGSAQTLGTITWHFKAGANDKEAVHVHDWQPKLEQRWVVDQEAWVEEDVPYSVWKCLKCDITFESKEDAQAHFTEYALKGELDHNGTVLTEYKDVYHEEIGHWETVTVGYECAGCGETVGEAPGGDGE